MAYESAAVDPGASPTLQVAVDTVAGKEIQIVKLDVGGDGLSDPVVGALPVSDGGGSITVDGIVGVSGAVEVVNDVGNPLPVSGPLTDTELRASSVPVAVIGVAPGFTATDLGKRRDDPAGAADVGVMMLARRTDTVGTLVSADGDYSPLQVGPNGQLRVLPASEYKVVGTGNLTAGGNTVAGDVSEYGTALLSVSGTYGSAVLAFEGFDGVSWHGVQTVRTDSNVVETGTTALTNVTRAWELACHGFAQVRVRCVSIVSGTVAVRIAASGAAIEPVPASQAVADAEVTGSLAALNAAVGFPLVGGRGAILLQVTGTFVGTIQFQGSGNGGANYGTGVGVPISGISASVVASLTAPGQWVIPVGGFSNFRVQMTAYTSGTANVTMRAVAASPATFVAGGALATVDRISTSVTPGNAAANLGKAEDAVAASGDTGVFALSVRRDTVTAAPASAAGDYQEIVTGADGLVGVRVVPSSVTTGAPTRHRLASSAASTNATSVKATAGRLYEVRANNATAATKFLKIYDKASAPTVGTDVPVLTIPLKPNTVDGGLTVEAWPLQPQDFTLGIAYAITGVGTDADATALAAGDVLSLTMRYL